MQKIIAKIKRVIKAKIAINKGLFVAQRSESFIPKVGLVLGAYIEGDAADDINKLYI
jgi:hypothetical protein